MNYQHLQYFVQVVQNGSIKAAAEQLGVSQPAISIAIQNLEQDFGAKLLDRRREGSVPTACGKTLYDSVVTMSSVVRNARAKIAAIKDPAQGHLRIGTGPSVSADCVAVALSNLLTDYPDIQVTHVTQNGYETFEQLLNIEDIDVALCHVPKRRLPKTLDTLHVSDNSIVALVGSAALTKQQTTLSSADMRHKFRWITQRDDEIRIPPNVDPPTSKRLLPPITVLTEDPALLKNLILTTASIGFLPVYMVENELESGELVQLTMEGSLVTRPIYALTRKTSEPAPLVERFLDEIAQAYSAADQRSHSYRSIAIVS